MRIRDETLDKYLEKRQKLLDQRRTVVENVAKSVLEVVESKL